MDRQRHVHNCVNASQAAVALIDLENSKSNGLSKGEAIGGGGGATLKDRF